MGQRSDIPLPIDPYRFTVVLVGTSHAATWVLYAAGC